MERFLKKLKNSFVPHEGNEYKPHFLRHQSMLMCLFVVIIIELLFLVQIFIVFNKTNFLAAVLPGVLTSITNEERRENNATPLVQNDLLERAAQFKAYDMATKGYFAHTSPEGKTPWYWLDQVGYNYSRAGENLAVNFFESSDVAKAWMSSPTHRANIVKKNFTQIGIAVAKGIYEGRSTVFVVQFFGTPAKIIPQILPTPQVGHVAKKPESMTEKSTAPITPIVTKVLGEETVAKILTSPRESATYVYWGIALLILFALLLALFVRSEIRHPLMILRGLGLIAIIFFFLLVNIYILNLKTKILDNGITLNTTS